MDSLSPSIANFVLAYAEQVAIPNLPRPELIFTIIPDICFLIIGRTACVVLINPNTLVSYCDFISSILRSSNAPDNPYPALFTNISNLLLCSIINLIAFFTELSSVTSSCTIFNGRTSFSAIILSSELLAKFLIVAYVVNPFLASISAFLCLCRLNFQLQLPHTVYSKDI